MPLGQAHRGLAFATAYLQRKGVRRLEELGPPLPTQLLIPGFAGFNNIGAGSIIREAVEFYARQNSKRVR